MVIHHRAHPGVKGCPHAQTEKIMYRCKPEYKPVTDCQSNSKPCKGIVDLALHAHQPSYVQAKGNHIHVKGCYQQIEKHIVKCRLCGYAVA